MTYYTLVKYDYCRSKEGRETYQRLDGKILLFTSWAAAHDWRNANFDKHQIRLGLITVSRVEVPKLRKDHRLMEGEDNV